MRLLQAQSGKQLGPCTVNLADLWLIRRCGRSIDVTFHDQKDGSVKTVQVPLGQSLLEAAHNNDIDLEGTDDKVMAAPDFHCSHITAPTLHLTTHGIAGACEGSLACSTCHVVVEVGLQQQSCLQLAADSLWSYHLT